MSKLSHNKLAAKEQVLEQFHRAPLWSVSAPEAPGWGAC